MTDQPTITAHESRCAVCWLQRELSFAEDEYGDGLPGDLVDGVDVYLGSHTHLADADQCSVTDEEHDDYSAESHHAAASAAQFIADYRRLGTT